MSVIPIETAGQALPGGEQASWKRAARAGARRSLAARVRGELREARQLVTDVLELRRRRRESLAYPFPCAPEHVKIDWRFAVEEHHRSYRKPWCLGRDHFDYLVSRGLKPHHTVLDFGCGCLRTGVWLIDYLQAGHYFGIESHYTSLQAAVGYEIPLHGLEPKRPRLLWDAAFSCEHFGQDFDFVLAFSVLNWIGPERAIEALARMAASLKPHGRIVTYAELPVRDEVLRERLGLRVSHRGTIESRFFREIDEFAELVREPEASAGPAGT